MRAEIRSKPPLYRQNTVPSELNEEQSQDGPLTSKQCAFHSATGQKEGQPHLRTVTSPEGN